MRVSTIKPGCDTETTTHMLDLSRFSTDDKIQLTFFAGMCESAKFSPYIHPSEALQVTVPCSGRERLNVVTCQDRGRDQDLADVGGLDMMNVRLNNSRVRLPAFIPIIPRDLFKRSLDGIDSKTVGVVLNDVMTKKLSCKCGHYQLPRGSEVEQDVLLNEAFRGKSVILFSTGPDVLLESLWWERHHRNLFDVISSMGFAGVTGMNFSLITGECPFAHALNIKKSICYCQELDRRGIWTIPHIYAINCHQRERWKAWLQANHSVRVVTINSQLQKRQVQGMTEVCDTVEFLLAETSVGIIVHGGSTRDLIRLNRQFGNRVHFAASGPLKSAIIRKDRSPAGYVRAFRHDLKQEYN